jgi:hypothetical protein
MKPQLNSRITRSKCGFSKEETMPTDATNDNAVLDYLTQENATQWQYFNNPR